MIAPADSPHLPGYRLGLPAWAFPGWRGTYFPANVSTLASYASVFSTVEGNTTFYQTPGPDTVKAWCEALAGSDFRICFKLPREITHESRPRAGALTAFLRAIEPLEEHLGPLLLQFPARVGPAQLGELDRLIAALPDRLRGTIEVRHRQFFSEPELLEPLLQEHDLGRVVMDTRPLFEGDLGHPELLQALHEKPDLPVLPRVYNGLSLIRLVLHPDGLHSDDYMREWAKRVAQQIADGIETHMMIHCPNNLHCPELAARFHQLLREQPGMQALPPLPPWPLPQQGQLL